VPLLREASAHLALRRRKCDRPDVDAYRAIADKVSRLADEGNLDEAEATILAAEASGLATTAALGWYVLAERLELAAAQVAYRRAIERGTPEVQAWAGVKLGRMLAEMGDRDAARQILITAARIGNQNATEAAIKALDAMTEWPPLAANLALTAGAVTVGGVTGGALVRVRLPVDAGGDAEGWAALVNGLVFVVLSFIIWRWRLASIRR
jgi:tetratricopeptide (TPR) repeat protein